jgi:photosystem II stability/assembly factor-like uncharacterized protein
MKPTIFAAFLLCLAATGRAQLNQQADSLPAGQGWLQANSGTTSGAAVPTYPSLDTAWAWCGVDEWSINNNLKLWQTAPINLGAPWMLSGALGYFSGSGDAIYRTTDAGKSWDTLHTGLQANTSGIGCVVSPAEVFVIGSNYVAGTLDSGSTWNIQGTNANELVSISFADSMVGYTVDGEGGPNSVLKTTNAGMSWLNVSDQADESGLGGVFAFTRNLVITLGATINRTTDGGQTWASVWDNSKTGVRGVCFKGKNGFAVGYQGTILASTDSGLSWSQQNSPTTSDLYTIAMYDSIHAVAAGANGTILVTNNGGQSWVNPSNSSNDSLAIQVFPNPSNTQVQFNYNLPTPESITFGIYSTDGSLVTPLITNVPQPAGTQFLILSTAALASGSYIYRLSSADYTSSGAFNIIH